jgi:hypothetical protein
MFQLISVNKELCNVFPFLNKIMKIMIVIALVFLKTGFIFQMPYSRTLPDEGSTHYFWKAIYFNYQLQGVCCVVSSVLI